MEQCTDGLSTERTIGGPKNDWRERTIVRNRTIKHLKFSVAHTKACCNLSWYGSFNISRFSRS